MVRELSEFNKYSPTKSSPRLHSLGEINDNVNSPAKLYKKYDFLFDVNETGSLYPGRMGTIFIILKN
jgi:hypothetical protein